MKRPYLLLAVSLAFTVAAFALMALGEREQGLAVGLFFLGCALIFGGEIIGGRERAAANARRAKALYAEFYFARARMRMIAFGGALMGAGSGLMGSVGAPAWVSWMGMAFGLLCFVAIVPKTFDRSPQLTFDQRGLTWPRLFTAPLAWSQIAAIAIEPTGIELIAAPGAPAPKPSLFGKPRTRVILSDLQLDGDLAALLGAIHRFNPMVQVAGFPEEA